MAVFSFGGASHISSRFKFACRGCTGLRVGFQEVVGFHLALCTVERCEGAMIAFAQTSFKLQATLHSLLIGCCDVLCTLLVTRISANELCYCGIFCLKTCNLH
ncbi:hypothetical protein NC653_014288 [Populus alba x Populus x berolinensis]|uniref:Uncharacterized protein n=1 Tax=Populus alba x Populus x berolinensis TaxID=444605 RepID=A0AAD6QWN7_9ROSI|nr:hypothetical protein NC653_014288 [Populus alba x Populus x berolinensis]